MPTYSYLPLRYDDWIRVIELSRGTNEDSSVHCSITRRRLSDPMLSYEAISYTWGDPLALEILFCGGHNAELSITRNCYNALRSLRRSDKSRTIWIDAICINQQNILERSSQVRIMDRIYTFASQVVVYLGEETPGSRLLFDELVEADSLYEVTQSFEGRPWPNAELVYELDNLFRRPWFSRIWVIQEVSVAREVTIVCGTSYASMLALYECAFGYQGTRVTKSRIPVSVYAAVGGCQAWRTCDTATSIWQLLADTRNCGATDRRDKIFALKALIQDDQRDLDQLIDYSRSIEGVFNDVTMLLLPRVRLWLLLAVRHPHTLKMPSWMPDWSGESTPNIIWKIGFVPLANAKEEFTISQLKCSHMECIGQHSILHVQGIQHSRITHLAAPFDFEGAVEFCFQVLQHFIPELEVARLLPGLRHACGNSCRDILPPPIFEILQYLCMDDRIGLLSRGQFSYPYHLKWVLDNNEEIQYITTELQNCRIFLTNDGTIGLAPTEACEGDMLCILRGSRSPSILRQRRENGWNLVSGDCFVLGELNNLTDDGDLFSTYVDAHRDQEQEFLIW